MRKIIIAIAAIAVIAGAAAVFVSASKDRTTDVSVDKARSTAEADTGTDAAEHIEGMPDVGVYTYTGSGMESVSALGGSEHEFPEEIPVTVTRDGDACQWQAVITFVEESEMTRHYCGGPDADAFAETGFQTDVTFFFQQTVRAFECTDATLAWDTLTAGDKLAWTCAAEDGSTLDSTGTYVGPETLSIEGADVATHHIKTTGVYGNGTSGTTVAEWWYRAEDGLPVQFDITGNVRSKAAFGETDYDIKYRYTLSESPAAG